MATIYPSLLAANPLNLSKEIEALDPYTYGYHIDIMDNHFVPNLAFSSALTNAIAKVTHKKLWVHLMIEKPLEFIDTLFLPPESIVSFHYEATTKDHYLAKRIRDKKWSPSITIKPGTPLNSIFTFLPDIDQVVLMSVEPGFSGQSFITDVTEKIGPLIGYRQSSGLSFRIGMDGGINENNIKELAQKGVDDFAVGSAIFDQPDKVKVLQRLQKLVGEKA